MRRIRSGSPSQLAVVATALVLVSCSVGGKASKSIQAAGGWRDVDELYPGPELPSLESQHTVRLLLDSNVLRLENGETIALAGMNCGPEMFDYMQALFFGNEPDFLVYELSGYVLSGIHHAYVWDISPWELGDPDLEFAPETVSLNEIGLLSGWCEPVEQNYHRYHKRYMALSKKG